MLFHSSIHYSGQNNNKGHFCAWSLWDFAYSEHWGEFPNNASKKEWEENEGLLYKARPIWNSNCKDRQGLVGRTVQ